MVLCNRRKCRVPFRDRLNGLARIKVDFLNSSYFCILGGWPIVARVPRSRAARSRPRRRWPKIRGLLGPARSAQGSGIARRWHIQGMEKGSTAVLCPDTTATSQSGIGNRPLSRRMEIETSLKFGSARACLYTDIPVLYALVKSEFPNKVVSIGKTILQSDHASTPTKA